MKLKHTLEGDILRNCSCDFGERLSGLNRVPVNWRWKILRSESGLRRLMLVSSTCLSNLLAHFYESRDIALVDLLYAQGASDMCTYLSHQLLYVEKADMK